MSEGRISRNRAAEVYQEDASVAGEIAPLGRAPGMGAIGKTLETFQHTANGLLPSATFTYTPPEQLQ
jgi:hypothetical protein